MLTDLVIVVRSDIGKLTLKTVNKLVICVKHGVNKMENVQAVIWVMD